jgi:hypothetical protein
MPFCFKAPCQFIPLFNLRFNALWLDAHLDAARRVQISQHRTKQGGCMLTANYVSHRVFAIQFKPHYFICTYLSIFLFYLQTP